MPSIDLEFSLALHNRTGKYFIGRDLINDQCSLINNVYYWRIVANAAPTGLAAKLIGRGLWLEQHLRIQGKLRMVPPLRTSRPLLHLDPFTVLHTALEPRDLVLCHDLGPITHPDLFDAAIGDLYKRAYDMIAQVRPALIFVSQSSRDAFRRCYGDLPKMHVIYPPVRAEVRCDEVRPVVDIRSPYLLTVGSIGRRKNQVAAIRGFARSGLADRGVGYVICGAREPGADVVEAEASETAGVHHLPYVSDAELAWLYDNAAGFVLVSRLEGFGVPVAEAIERGLVPLVTKNSVLVEVAGEGALTADPHDYEQIAAGMNHLVDMPEDEKKARLELLNISVERFSSERFAREWRTLLDAAVAQQS